MLVLPKGHHGQLGGQSWAMQQPCGSMARLRVSTAQWEVEPQG